MIDGYCPKCHEKRNGEPGTACGICGTVLCGYDSPVNYLFAVDRGFSYIHYKEINTEVELKDDGVEITQTNTWFAFFKRPSSKVSIPYADIQDIEIYRSWNYWNLLFAALITIISGVCRWYWILFVLLFLYTATGRIMAIHYKDDAVLRVPISAFGKGPRVDQFIAELNQRILKGVQ